jgi:hypothetical protein
VVVEAQVPHHDRKGSAENAEAWRAIDEATAGVSTGPL